MDEEAAKRIHRAARSKVESLWDAVWNGDLARVRAILKEGNHDVNGLNRWQTQIDPRGWRRTPLHAAALRGHLEILRFFLELGAEVDPATKYGDTPLHLAVGMGGLEIVRLLLKHGADPDRPNDDNRTATQLAEQRRDEDILRALKTRR